MIVPEENPHGKRHALNRNGKFDEAGELNLLLLEFIAPKEQGSGIWLLNKITRDCTWEALNTVLKERHMKEL